MKFNLVEKLAIIKAIDEVIMADGKVKPGEVTLMSKLAGILRFDMGMLQEARKTDAKECISILKSMPQTKKHALKVMLTEAANADKEVDEKELLLIQGILKAAGMESIDSASHLS